MQKKATLLYRLYLLHIQSLPKNTRQSALSLPSAFGIPSTSQAVINMQFSCIWAFYNDYIKYCISFFTFGVFLVFKIMFLGLLVVLGYAMWRVWCSLTCYWKSNKQGNEPLPFISFYCFFPNIYYLSLSIPHGPTFERKVRSRKKKGRNKMLLFLILSAEGFFFFFFHLRSKTRKLSSLKMSIENILEKQETQFEDRMDKRFCSVLSVLGWHLLFWKQMLTA